jgi:hypothetical protein
LRCVTNIIRSFSDALNTGTIDENEMKDVELYDDEDTLTIGLNNKDFATDDGKIDANEKEKLATEEPKNGGDNQKSPEFVRT